MKGAVDTSGSTPKVVAWDRAGWTATRGGRPGPPANLPSGILLGFPELPLAGLAAAAAEPGAEHP